MKNYGALLKAEFHGYNKEKLWKDLMAGITVAAVALPLALAFGVSSGADAASGMITAVISGLVIGALSGGFYQISGPTGAMAAILMGIIATYQLEGVFVATFLAGLFLLIAGIFKLGVLTSLIPSSVITGFTSGIAIIIAAGQIDNFFGVHSEGHSTIAKLLSYGKLGFQPQLSAVLFGGFVILFMLLYPKRWNSVVPASLVAILLTTAFQIIVKTDATLVGAIPTTLLPERRLHLGQLNWEMIQGLITPALSIAALGMIESLLCGASAGRMTGKNLDNNQELIAQGIGNLILPFFGGIPATAAIARTSVAVKSGAQTRLTGIFHAVFLMASMFLLAPLMSQIPLAALAGVLMVTAWRMNEWHAIHYLFQHKFKRGLVKFFVTMVATVVFDLSIAILIGIGLGVLFFLAENAKLTIEGEKNPQQPDWYTLQITGSLFFMNSEKLQTTLEALPENQHLVLNLQGVPSIDVTSLKVLLDYCHTCHGQNKKVVFVGMQPSLEKSFERAGILALTNEDVCFQRIEDVFK